MNPKQFLVIGGIILVVVGILGFIGLIGPTSESSIFGTAWWFDNAENWAHLVLGVVALVVAYWVINLQSVVTLLVGILALLVGLWGFLIGGMFLGANLQNPLDNILHLVIGVWALWAWRRNAKKAPMMSQSSPM